MSLSRKAVSRMLFLLAALGLAWAADLSPACGTTIRGRTFEELVVGADLVAIAECVGSGGITARYRAVKVYKGDLRSGATFVLLVPPSQHGPVFPVTFAGQVFLVTAWKKENPPSSRLSSISGGGSPIPAPTFAHYDYVLPLFQGRFLLKRDGKGAFAFSGDRTGGAWSGGRPADFAAAEALIGRLGDPAVGGDLLVLSLARRALSQRYGPLPAAVAAEPTGHRDIVRAYGWFALAAVFGRPGAEASLAAVASRMTEDQRVAAKAWAADELRAIAPRVDHMLSRSTTVDVAAAFEKGDQVARRPGEAYAWYLLAGQGSYVPDKEAGKAGRARLAAELGPDGVRRAEERAAELRALMKSRRRQEKNR